jgi:hypothetical protein
MVCCPTWDEIPIQFLSKLHAGPTTPAARISRLSRLVLGDNLAQGFTDSVYLPQSRISLCIEKTIPSLTELRE